MNGGPQRLEVFQVELLGEVVEGQGVRVRAFLRLPGLTAGLTLWPEEAELKDLLGQIEGQYHDFKQPVRWEVARDGKRLSLAWTLDALGHVQEGEASLEDGAARWQAAGPLTGDQSYLPRIAMGLQLLLRA